MNISPWENPESVLGIEYERHFAQPFLDIFLRGEQEWLKNAPDTYGWDAGEVWASDVFEHILTGKLTDIDREDLKLYTPKMLQELSQTNIWTVKNRMLHDILTALST